MSNKEDSTALLTKIGCDAQRVLANAPRSGFQPSLTHALILAAIAHHQTELDSTSKVITDRYRQSFEAEVNYLWSLLNELNGVSPS